LKTSSRATLKAQLRYRLRFDALVAELSARFVNVPADKLDREIENAQRQVCEHLGLDQSALWQLDCNDPTVQILTHLYRPLGGHPLPVRMDAKEYFPWSLRQVSTGEVLVIASTEDLPPEAARDKEVRRYYGIKSTLCFPLSVGGGPLIGGLSFETTQAECGWSKLIIRRLKLLAQIFTNALARKLSDQLLRESEARLSLAADSAEAGLWILDLGSERFWATQKARELFGFPPNFEITMESFLQRVHPEDCERIRRVVESSLQNNKNICEDYRIVHPDGRIRWISSQGRPRCRADGTVDGLMGISMDTTEQKQRQMELEQANAEICQLKERLQKENQYLRQEVTSDHAQWEIIGQSEAIQRVLSLAVQVAPAKTPVLIQGETGTGKELIAHLIHRRSPRHDRLLVKLDCTSLPATLVESELFGREKGAYTGALSRQAGRFEIANGSTIFLDEIGDLPLELQAKLLRVLQEGKFERLGSPKTISTDVRVIAATNRNLAECVRRGTFREDLYYRLNVFPIHLPPLRDRIEDIPLLTQSFVEEFARTFGRKIERMPRSAMEPLMRYPWPGNIRELRNIIERAMIISSGDALEVELPLVLSGDSGSFPTLDQSETAQIRAALKRSGSRIKGAGGAASLLGIKPSTLYTRMKKRSIAPREQRQEE
jgi:formate hydrogenlyase transcriptional activator